MAPSPAPPKSAAGGGTVAYNMAWIALAVALCGVGLAYGIDAAAKARRDTAAVPGPELSRTIGGRHLVIPSAWFRFPEDEGVGFSEQVELRLLLPLGPGESSRPVDVTLLPASRVRPSAGLLDGVYLHRFTNEQLDGPPGLIGKPLAGDAGYEGETVWYDPLSINPFVAKCSAPVAAEAASRCVRTVQLAPGLAAVYVFDTELLTAWKRFDAEMRRRLETIGVF